MNKEQASNQIKANQEAARQSERIDKMWSEMVKRSEEVRQVNKECAEPKGLLRWIPTTTG